MLLAPAIACAAPKQRPTPHPTTPSASALTAIDADAASLPAHYRGHSCPAVVGAFKLLNAHKGEFETTKAYAERIAQIDQARLYGQLSTSSLLGFVPGKAATIFIQYDADAGEMRLSVSQDHAETMLVNNKFVRTALVDHKPLSRKTYRAANAFGRQVTVTESHYYACALAFTNIESRSTSDFWSTDVRFTIGADEARAVKDRLQVMYVGQLVTPYDEEYSHYEKPTVDEPEEYFAQGQVLAFNLAAIWVFDPATGKVFAKQTSF